MFIQIKGLSLHPHSALVAKLVDAPDLGSGVAIRVGSSPIRRTFLENPFWVLFFCVCLWRPLCLVRPFHQMKKCRFIWLIHRKVVILQADYYQPLE